MIDLFQSLFAPPRHLILVLAALWIGLALAERRADRFSVSGETLSNLIYYSLIGYVLGGRLLYTLANFPVFVQSPLSLVSLNLDLFDPLAALVAALAAGLIYGSRQRLLLWQALDALTPFFAAVMVGLALSHIAAGTAFGSPTDLSWGIEQWGATRHPSQIYELVASLLIFGLVWFHRGVSAPGSLFLIFAACAAGTRLFLEAFRGDSTFVLGGLRLTQGIAWILLAVALIVREWLLQGRGAESER